MNEPNSEDAIEVMGSIVRLLTVHLQRSLDRSPSLADFGPTEQDLIWAATLFPDHPLYQRDKKWGIRNVLAEYWTDDIDRALFLPRQQSKNHRLEYQLDLIYQARQNWVRGERSRKRQKQRIQKEEEARRKEEERRQHEREALAKRLEIQKEFIAKIKKAHASIGSRYQVSPVSLGLSLDNLVEGVGNPDFEKAERQRVIEVIIAFDPGEVANCLMSQLDRLDGAPRLPRSLSGTPGLSLGWRDGMEGALVQIALHNDIVRPLVIDWWAQSLKLNSWPQKITGAACKHLAKDWFTTEEIDQHWFDKWLSRDSETDIFGFDLLASMAHLGAETFLSAANQFISPTSRPRNAVAASFFFDKNCAVEHHIEGNKVRIFDDAIALYQRIDRNIVKGEYVRPTYRSVRFLNEKLGYKTIRKINDWEARLQRSLNQRFSALEGTSRERVSWEVLPVGWSGNGRELERVKELLSGAQESLTQQLDRERLAFLDQLRPLESYIGTDSLGSRVYVLGIFDHHVVAECPLEGNALYVVEGTEDWRELFKHTKTDFRTIAKDRFKRIIHKGDWRSRLRKALS